eukprot:jgi/Undpi1/2336/HiC_scaffold_13.g05719.m1
MAGGGFLSWMVSGATVLAVISTVRRAEGASSTEVSDSCGTEYLACILDDDICRSCTSEYDWREFEDCLADSDYDVVSVSGLCDSYALTACCQDQASENECIDNEAFMEYWTCVVQAADLGSSDCSFTEATCSSVGSSDAGSDSSGDGSSVGASDSSADDSSAGVSNSMVAGSLTPSRIFFPGALGLAAALVGRMGT